MRAFIFLIAALSWAGEPGTKVEYVGGTLGELRPGNDLRIQADDPVRLTISTKGRSLRIPYDQVNQIEYGQKIGRHVFAAITVSPLFLLNKSRKHFLTLGFTDPNGDRQAVVVRVEKGDIRAILASLEARTGMKVTYLDDEARKM